VKVAHVNGLCLWAGLSGLEGQELAKIEEDTRVLANEAKINASINI
jgi:hypothetical protein